MPSEQLILGIDTSAAHCAAALLCGDRIVASRHEEMARGQAERLFPLLQSVLGDTAWDDLAAIGVGTGPGNFIGLRIAVSAARGLALSLGIPAIGVSRFETQVEGAGRPALSMIPAPRDQVYVQDFADNLPTPRLLPAEEARRRAGAAQLAIGAPFGREVRHPIAESVCRIAAQRLRNGGPHPRPVPTYIRPADAAPAREAAPVLLP